MKVSFNGGSENDSPYYKGDINYDTGQTCLREVGVFATRQRREQYFNHIERRFDVFCMVERSMKKLEVNLKETKGGCRLYIFIVLLGSVWLTNPYTSGYKPIKYMNDNKQRVRH